MAYELRYIGTYVTKGAYEFKAGAPLDTRSVVATKKHLISASVWANSAEYVYTGLPVYVEGTKEYYQLVDKAKLKTNLKTDAQLGTITDEDLEKGISACWEKLATSSELHQELKNLGPVFKFCGVALARSYDGKYLTVGDKLTFTTKDQKGATTAHSLVCAGFEYDLPHDRYYAWAEVDKENNYTVYAYTKDTQITASTQFYKRSNQKTDVFCVDHDETVYYYDALVNETVYTPTVKKGTGSITVVTTPSPSTKLTYNSNEYTYSSVEEETLYTGAKQYWWKFTLGVNSFYVKSESNAAPTESIASVDVYDNKVSHKTSTQRWWKFTSLDDTESVHAKTSGTSRPTSTQTNVKFYRDPDSTVEEELFTDDITKFQAYTFSKDLLFATTLSNTEYKYDSIVSETLADSSKQYWWKFVTPSGTAKYAKATPNTNNAPTAEVANADFYSSAVSTSTKFGTANIVKYTTTVTSTSLVEANSTNNGHVYQIEEDEYASNGLIWVQLGTPSDEWVVI